MTGGAIQRHRFTTEDPDRGHEYIRRMYVETDVVIRGHEDEFRFSADALQIGACTLSQLRHTMAVAMQVHDGVARPTLFYEDKTLPSLPASVANVMQTGRAGNRRYLMWGESALEQAAIPFDLVINGSYALAIEVK